MVDAEGINTTTAYGSLEVTEMSYSIIEIMQLTVAQKNIRITEIECEFDNAQAKNEFFYRTAQAQALRDELEMLIRSML